MMQMKSKPPSSPHHWDANAHYQDARIAHNYDVARFSSFAGRTFNKWERRIVVRAFSTIPANGRIADVPCGTGRLAEPLLNAGYRVHGMDISSQMLDVAASRLSRFGGSFTTEVADARSLTKAVPGFDGVLCARVLMHFELDEQIEFLRGAARLTQGVVVINHSYDSTYQRFRRGVKRVLAHQAPARFPVTDEQISRLLAGAGLCELHRKRLNLAVSEAVYIVATPLKGS